jgi:ABC-type multidrug transport system ATPase subunit
MPSDESLNLVCQGVSKSYSNQVVFKHLDLRVASKHLLIIGPNGCGKTTLLRLIAGIETVDEGSVSWQGKVVTAVETKQRVGMSANCIVLPEFLSVRQIIAFHCRQYQCDFPEQRIDDIALSPFLGQKISALSLGTAKKLSLVLAFAHEPDLLILDEPGNGLDDSALSTLKRWLEVFAGNIVLATHDQTLCQGLETELVDLAEVKARCA